MNFPSLTVVLGKAGAVIAMSMVAAQQFPSLLDANYEQLREGLDNQVFTSLDLVKAYEHRIEETNERLHAVSEINPDALHIARGADHALANDKNAVGRPLLGLPLLVHDNIATADKMNNTAGSRLLLGARVPEDSTVVAKLRKAGAVILGKTTMVQWASAFQNGVAYGGQVVGAYFAGQHPFGSCSGSAVAVSVGLAWGAIATDTSGSIILPAQRNNVVGIAPTLGLTSRYLVLPISKHFDTIGPIARTVKDAAHLLAAIAGPDSRDNYTAAIPFDQLPDYVSACTLSGLENKRIGVARNLQKGLLQSLSGHTDTDFEDALTVLRDAGATVVDDLPLPDLNSTTRLIHKIKLLRGHIQTADFEADVTKYLSLLTINPQNVSFDAHMRQHVYPGSANMTRQGNSTSRQADSLDRYFSTPQVERLNNTSAKIWRYRQKLSATGRRLGFADAFENDNVDAFIAPSYYVPEPAYALGFPVVTIPWGKTSYDSPYLEGESLNLTGPNQPFGISFFGPKWSEETLISIAYAFEQATLVRQQISPSILPTTELTSVV